MPVAIVDPLKIIDVQEKNREAGSVTIRAANLLIENRQQVASIVGLSDVIYEGPLFGMLIALDVA